MRPFRPEAPAQPGSHRANMNSIFLMSKRPLAEKTTYEVRIRCLHASRPFEKRWTFTTG